MPESLILADISHAHMDYYRIGELKYLNTPNLTNGFRPEHTLARSKLNKFYQQEIDQSQIIHFETDKMKEEEPDIDPESYNDYTIYESNRKLKRKIAKPQLTASRIVCAQHSKKVFFGQPEPLLLMEDICSRTTLKELRETF